MLSVGPVQQGQLVVQIQKSSNRQYCRASCWPSSTEPVIGPDLQGQLLVYFYKVSYRSVSTGPIVGLDLQVPLPSHLYRASCWSMSIGLVISQFDLDSNKKYLNNGSQCIVQSVCFLNTQMKIKYQKIACGHKGEQSCTHHVASNIKFIQTLVKFVGISEKNACYQQT